MNRIKWNNMKPKTSKDVTIIMVSGAIFLMLQPLFALIVARTTEMCWGSFMSAVGFFIIGTIILVYAYIFNKDTKNLEIEK